MATRALIFLVTLWTSNALAQALPFSEVELVEALAARAPELSPSSLRIEHAGELLMVTLGMKTRVLDLAGETGMDAARVVALVAADLSMLELPTVPPSLTLPVPVLRPARADRIRLGLEGSVMHGMQRYDTWGFTLGMAGSFVTRRFSATLQASHWTMPKERSRFTWDWVRFDALLLRAGMGVRVSRYTLEVGPVYARAWVRADRSITADLFGASLQGSVWLPASRHARLGVRLYVDLYPRRAFFRVLGPEILLATPNVALGIALSAAWGWS